MSDVLARPARLYRALASAEMDTALERLVAWALREPVVATAFAVVGLVAVFRRAAVARTAVAARALIVSSTASRRPPGRVAVGRPGLERLTVPSEPL